MWKTCLNSYTLTPRNLLEVLPSFGYFIIVTSMLKPNQEWDAQSRYLLRAMHLKLRVILSVKHFVFANSEGAAFSISAIGTRALSNIQSPKSFSCQTE
mmetsp:Transcript_16360/g.18514  ORF Transcript_16360/g.18514 Transcript_16360/m.18514 type:complete len:98 (-) Transcript_16360:58-351(-)